MLKPTSNFILNNNQDDLIIQIMDYYRCIDTLEGIIEEDTDNDILGGDDNDNDEDSDDGDEDGAMIENLYSKDKQKELSKSLPMLIKLFGILESGHSVTVNLQGFEPFFYIKIPDHWEVAQCRILVTHLRNLVYYRYKEHLLKTQMVVRKPFSEFTGEDKFKFLKLQFKNKESYDQYSYKFAYPIKVSGLNDDRPLKYDLYESNIDPIIKFIHLTKINPSGWIKIPKQKYQIISDKSKRTTMTNFEIKLKWDQIIPHDRLESVPINVMSFDIEADSSHGDFPIGIKNYQKLSQELVTLYNGYGVHTAKTKIHPLFANPTSSKRVIQNLLRLVFDDDYQTNNIHQIHTVDNIKPHPETIEQLRYTISLLMECEPNQMRDQLTDLLEYNLPAVDMKRDHNSHYGLLADEMIGQLSRLAKNNNRRFREGTVTGDFWDVKFSI